MNWYIKAQNLNSEKSVEDIAKKHNIPIEDVEKELKMGIEIELEHTSDRKIAEKIAKDHLWEFKKYYTELSKMEKRLKGD